MEIKEYNESTGTWENKLDANTLQGKIPDDFASKEDLELVKKSVANGKSLIASAISAHGISTAIDASFETLATNISNIQSGIDTSDGTITSDDVAKNKIGYAKDTKIIGNVEVNTSTYNISSNSLTQTSSALKCNIPSAIYKQGVQIGLSNLAYALDIDSSKIVLGQSVCGIDGTGTIEDQFINNLNISLMGPILTRKFPVGITEIFKSTKESQINTILSEYGSDSYIINTLSMYISNYNDYSEAAKFIIPIEPYYPYLDKRKIGSFKMDGYLFSICCSNKNNDMILYLDVPNGASNTELYWGIELNIESIYRIK